MDFYSQRSTAQQVSTPEQREHSGFLLPKNSGLYSWGTGAQQVSTPGEWEHSEFILSDNRRTVGFDSWLPSSLGPGRQKDHVAEFQGN